MGRKSALRIKRLSALIQSALQAEVVAGLSGLKQDSLDLKHFDAATRYLSTYLAIHAASVRRVVPIVQLFAL